MKENYKDEIVKILKLFDREKVIISEHARIRIIQRQLSVEEIIENIINPVRLEYAIKETKNKYDCYFGYSKTQCHRYILLIKNNILVITAIKINRRWQKIVEKKLKC
jgi:hypothetical protein